MARQIIPTSGLWSSIVALFNANFTEVYEAVRYGIYDYNDLATQSTPINIAAANTWYPLTNDALGPFTNKDYALPDVADVWDTTTQAFDFSGMALGDTVDIRLDVSVTSGTVNQSFDIDIFIDDGGAGEYQLPFIVQQTFKSTGTRQVIRFNSIYLGDDITRLNAARFKIRSDSTGSVKVNGWYVRAMKRVI